MITDRLYKTDSYLRSCETQIFRVANVSGRKAVILKESVLFPEGGGQSSDRGTLTLLYDVGSAAPKDGQKYQVLEVYEHDGEIYNLLDTADDIPIGSRCRVDLDWQRRFDNMQRHSGEHLLTGIFHREYGLTNRGFHMGDDYMTIDLALEGYAKVNELTWDMVKEAELLANEAIYQDLPIIVRYFGDNYREASKQPQRKPLSVKKDITLVGIGSNDEEWGCVACCGTHLRSCAQVGLIKCFKLEPNKGMYRIYFEAGRRAFMRYQEELEVLHTLGRKMSAGTEDILAKYDAQTEKNREKYTQLSDLKKEVFAREIARITSELSDEAVAAGSIPAWHYHILSLDDLSTMSRDLSPLVKKLIFLVHDPSHTVLLVSDGTIKCGQLVRDNAGIYNGKGGGSDTFARAIFQSKDMAETFMDLIEKHLK